MSNNIELNEMAIELVKDNTYFGELDGESFDLDLDKELNNLRQSIVELALEYAEEERIQLRPRGL